MSNPAKPVWADPGALPFSLFAQHGDATAASPALGQPFAQGLAGGIDFMKKLWGQVPGNAAVPGFLLPTLDLDELDKRISDLKAAESWLEVNLNLLRATIQGLEVQRHTIAAIRSLGAGTETLQAPKAPSNAPPGPSGLPPGWPVAQAKEEEKSTEADVMESPVEATAAATKKPAHRSTRKSASPSAAPLASQTAALAGLSANNWLGYMQDQFAKVAQAALASSEVVRAHQDSGTGTARAKGAAKKASSPAAKTAVKSAAKRRASTGKERTAR